MSDKKLTEVAILREKCCYMVLHGGHPDPAKVVYAMEQMEAAHRADLDRVFDAALEAAIEAVENRCGILSDADDLDGYEAGANLCLQDIRALKDDAALRAQITGAGE